MATRQRFEDLAAWQSARELVRELYGLCANLRAQDDHGLCDRLCRAAVASMSNIADAFARRGHSDCADYLDDARVALTEVQSLLYVALDVGYVRVDQFEHLYRMAEDVGSSIVAYASNIRRFS